jgi:hypothetical protein
MPIKISKKVVAKKPSLAQHEYYCPFDKEVLYYLYLDDILFGLGSDRWVYCPNCGRIFILSNSNGFHQGVLEDIEILVKEEATKCQTKKTKK